MQKSKICLKRPRDIFGENCGFYEVIGESGMVCGTVEKLLRSYGWRVQMVATRVEICCSFKAAKASALYQAKRY